MKTTPTLLPGLVLALALTACGDEATGPPRDETPPVLEVLAPAPADSVLFAGPVRVRARCGEDAPGGCTVEVFLGGRVVAQGADSVDAVVPTAEHAGRAVRFVFVARNPGGGTTTAETGEIRLAATRWVPVVTTPGFLLDASLERALYSAGNDAELRLLDMRTGEDRVIGRNGSWYTGRGRHAVTPAGAIVSYDPSAAGSTLRGVREVGGSNVSDSRGSGASARGRWAAWRSVVFGSGATTSVLYRDDVLAASLTRTPDSLQASGGYALAENGVVAFTARPRAFGNDRIYLWNGSEVRLLSPDSATLWFSDYFTDGTGVLYAQSVPTAGGTAVRLVYHGARGEEVLAPLPGPRESLHPPEIFPHSGFQLRDGWAAYQLPVAPGTYRLWIRAPSGERHEVWPGSGALDLLSVGPAGEVLVKPKGTGQMYMVDAPHTRGVAVDALPFLGTFRWIDGSLYGLTYQTMHRLERAAAAPGS